MKRQLTPLPYELWSGEGVCILATDAVDGFVDETDEGFALLDVRDVHFVFGARVYVFLDLPVAAMETIQRGASGVVEFGPQGPVRETPIRIRQARREVDPTKPRQ